MILTCPACDTKYVVKDGAIPPAGRQVRCASCKHSWHQDAEPISMEPDSGLVDQPAAADDFGGPPPAGPAAAEPVGEVPPQAEAKGIVAGEPQPEADVHDEADWHPVEEEGPSDFDAASAGAAFEPYAPGEAAGVQPDEWPAPAPTPTVEEEQEFVGYAPIAAEEEEAGKRRWPLLLGLLIFIAAAAAAFWFLAPAEWKARAGIASAAATPLQLMITTSDRQPLESGNELVAISGRVINPTDQEQNVPPIRAELRDKQTNAVVHRWTIAPPARVLAPRSSASFNSAEVDVPKGGDELTVTLGG
jgi:predicted Zn finger-like uncharacterized protein